MKNRNRVIGITILAALLLSACNADTSAPASAERETSITAVTEEVSTTAATTTVTDLTAVKASATAVSTAEPEPVRIPASISPGNHNDERLLRDEYDWQRFEDNEREYVSLYSRNSGDLVNMMIYYLDQPGSHTEEIDEKHEELIIDTDAANLMVRPSVNAMSDKPDNDIQTRLNKSMFTPTTKFGTAYDIKYDDPRLTMNFWKEDYGKERRYDYDIDDLVLGYTIDAPVTVNAFVCSSPDGLSVLVDPEYMHGLPMLSLGDTEFVFGNTVVSADSLLFTGIPVEGMSLDAADYAYAKVTMLDTHVLYSYTDGYANTCTVSDIEIIKEFSDIAELDITNDTDVLSGDDKDPEMLEVYNAIMDAKSDIYTDDTRGILLLDLDFDGKPEVISTRLTMVEDKQRADSDVYRVENGELKYIDTLHPIPYIGESLNSMYLGLSALKDGTKAWFMSKRIEDPETANYDDDEDHLYTLDGDSLTEHELLTRKTVKEPVSESNNYEPGEYEYYMFGEKIVPEIETGEGPYGEENYEILIWNGIRAYEEWELFGFIRAWFARNSETSYPLLSDWICDATSPFSARERYNVTDREFSHKIAYMIDDFYNERNNGVEHNYWFLGTYAKPVIYLYPEEQTDVSLQVSFPYVGELTCTYPDYGSGWNVTAMPDGTLYDANGDEYYCLYWEGDGAADLDMSKGFCVAGADTAKFLREKLIYIGLTAREANEFIIYWLPKMQDNPYNIITLHTDDYARSIPLTVSPVPDTQIRVFMTYYSSDTPVDIPEQELPHYERNGFTLVEWGGSEE